MQSQESNTGTTGSVKHPETSEWMGFLYEELAPERHRELETHLSRCATCRQQVTTWRASMTSLDHWTSTPAGRKHAPQMLPLIKWAVAAAIVLSVGFALGRQTSSTARELADLKTSLAQLADSVQRDRSATASNGVDVATAAASAETFRLLSEYARLQESQRTADQQALALTLNNLEQRVGRLRNELETVALNTETGFEETHENIYRLASLSVPAGNRTESPTQPQ